MEGCGAHRDRCRSDLGADACGEPVRRVSRNGTSQNSSLAGAGLIALSVSGLGTHELAGASLCVLVAVCYALVVVVQKPALRLSAALPMTWAACSARPIVLLEFIPQSTREFAHVSAATLLGVLYQGVGPTATAFPLGHLRARRSMPRVSEPQRTWCRRRA